MTLKAQLLTSATRIKNFPRPQSNVVPLYGGVNDCPGGKWRFDFRTREVKP